jgi:nucleoside-diphosphate-sugar epimerase
MAPAIPLGSVVLVTGVNGFIGSHIADQFLQAGYKVRGTVREASKADGLKALWEKNYGSGKFEAVEVPEMAIEGAFDEAVKGMFLRPMSFHTPLTNVQTSLEYAMQHTI